MSIFGFGISKKLEEPGRRLEEISTDYIVPNPSQPRTVFDEESIAALAQSIGQVGLIQPLVVRKSGPFYELVAGERRLRACKSLGMTTVPCIVQEDVEEEESAMMALIENLQREDLNIMEEAAGYRTLMEEHGMTQDQVASRVGKSRPVVANALRLLNLPQEVAQMVREGRLSAGHARALLSIGDASLQKEIAARAAEGAVTVRDIERMGKSAKAQQSEDHLAGEQQALAQARTQDSFYREVELALTQELGRKATVHLSRGKGMLQLEFYSKEDLQNLVRMLQGTDGE